jgi:hypothetical protein
MTSYRRIPVPIHRLWTGEDWVFSTILRDTNNVPVNLVGALVNLVIYENGSSVLSTDLETNDDTTDGVVSGSLTAQALFDALRLGPHTYHVRVRQGGVTQVGEAGKLEYLGGAMSPDPEPVVVLIQGEGDDILEQE